MKRILSGIDANRFRPMLESKLSTALKREVKLGKLQASLWAGGVTADDLSIADDPGFSRAAFVTAKSLALHLIEVRDFMPSAAFPFRVAANVGGGGSLKLEGKAGPIPADTSMTPVESSFEFVGIPRAEPAFAGVFSLHGHATSDGNAARLSGDLSGEKLKLAREGRPSRRPVDFRFALSHDRGKRSGVLSQGEIHVGKAPANLTGTYAERGDSTAVHMLLNGARMPVTELAELLPPLGIAMPAESSLQGGTATARLTIEGPVDPLVTAGSVAIEQTRLSGFDLGARMRAVAALAGIKPAPDTDFQTARLSLHMAPNQALAFKMRALMHTSDDVMRHESKAVQKAAGSLLQGIFGTKQGK